MHACCQICSIGHVCVAGFQQKQVERGLSTLLLWAPLWTSSPGCRGSGWCYMMSEGRYQDAWQRVLRFMGHMLVYDPQKNGAGVDCDEGIPLHRSQRWNRDPQVIWETSAPVRLWRWWAQSPHHLPQWNQQWSTQGPKLNHCSLCLRTWID